MSYLRKAYKVLILGLCFQVAFLSGCSCVVPKGKSYTYKMKHKRMAYQAMKKQKAVNPSKYDPTRRTAYDVWLVAYHWLTPNLPGKD